MIPAHRLMIEHPGPVLGSISHDLWSDKTFGLAQHQFNAVHLLHHPNYLDQFLIQNMHQCRMMKLRHDNYGFTMEKFNEAMQATCFDVSETNPLTLLVGHRQWSELTKVHPTFALWTSTNSGPNQARLCGDILVRLFDGLPVSSNIRSCFLYQRKTFHYELSAHSQLEDGMLNVCHQFSWRNRLGVIRIQCEED